jgi:DNA polymerase gamma 1
MLQTSASWPRTLSTTPKEKSQQDFEGPTPPDGSPQNAPKPRMNVANIQMIPENQRDILFKAPLLEPDPSAVLAMVSHLRSKGLWGFQSQPLPVPQIEIPPLYGNSIDEHFRYIAEEQIKSYVTALDNLLRNEAPPIPKKWIYKAGVYRLID